MIIKEKNIFIFVLICILILMVSITGCKDKEKDKIKGTYSDKTETEGNTGEKNDITTIEVYRDYESDVTSISASERIKDIVDAYTKQMNSTRVIPNNQRDGFGLSLTLKHKNGDCDEVTVWEDSFQVGEITYEADSDFLSTMRKLCVD